MGRRRCRRCGKNITARHGNAKYCLTCTGKRSKPYVHSVRLDRETHEKLLKEAKKKDRGVQQVLEKIIRSTLES
jgi:hypothetical protein